MRKGKMMPAEGIFIASMGACMLFIGLLPGELINSTSLSVAEAFSIGAFFLVLSIIITIETKDK